MKTFIELGACDFENLTPLLASNWRGFFIEPIPVYMSSLKESVAREGLSANAIFEESAITNYNGSIAMVYATHPTEEWQRGISHVNTDGKPVRNYTSNLVYRNNFRNEVINVNALTLNSFLKKHDIQQIDLLKIDVEGHELMILESYDWCIKPKLLKIEHKFVDYNRLVNLLYKNGYFVWSEQDDVYALLK